MKEKNIELQNKPYNDMVESICDEEVDISWDIDVEGKLNRNNTIFHNNKYQRLISKCKKINNFITKKRSASD